MLPRSRVGWSALSSGLTRGCSVARLWLCITEVGAQTLERVEKVAAPTRWLAVHNDEPRVALLRPTDTIDGVGAK